MDLLTNNIPTYLLAGQSNMAGGVTLEELPEGTNWPENVILIHDGGLVDPFQVAKKGPEWGMAQMWQKRYGDTPCLFVKYALGGKNLANEWNPAGAVRLEEEPELRDACWPRLLQAIDHAKNWSETNKVRIDWQGFAWMQGERDAVWPGMSATYEKHLRELLASVRGLTGRPELLAAIGLISPRVLVPELDRFRHRYRERVRAAQREVASRDVHAFLIETDDLPQRADNLHFNTLGKLVLGQRMMAALLCKPKEALPFGGMSS